MNTLVFKNWQLQPLEQLLDMYKLEVSESRLRTRFLRMLSKHTQEITEPERVYIIEKFCDRDENDNPIFKDTAQQVYQFSDPDRETEALHNLAELMNEEMPIIMDEYNKKMLLVIADLVVNKIFELEGLKLSGTYAQAVDYFMDEFEKVFEFYKDDTKKKEKKKK